MIPLRGLGRLWFLQLILVPALDLENLKATRIYSIIAQYENSQQAEVHDYFRLLETLLRTGNKY